MTTYYVTLQLESDDLDKAEDVAADCLAVASAYQGVKISWSSLKRVEEKLVLLAEPIQTYNQLKESRKFKSR